MRSFTGGRCINQAGPALLFVRPLRVIDSALYDAKLWLFCFFLLTTNVVCSEFLKKKYRSLKSRKSNSFFHARIFDYSCSFKHQEPKTPHVSFGHTGIAFANPSGTNKRHFCRICRGINFAPSYVRKKDPTAKAGRRTNEGIVEHCRRGCNGAVSGGVEQPGAEMAHCCASLCELPLKLTVFSFLMKSVFFFLDAVFLSTAIIVSLVCSPGVTCIRKCHGTAFFLSQEIVSPVCMPR